MRTRTRTSLGSPHRAGTGLGPECCLLSPRWNPKPSECPRASCPWDRGPGVSPSRAAVRCWTVSPPSPAAPTGEDRTPSASPTGPSFCTLHWGPDQQVTRGRRSAKPGWTGKQVADGRTDGRQVDRWMEGGQQPHCCAKTERPHDAGVRHRDLDRRPRAPPPAPHPSCPGPSRLHPPGDNAHGDGPRRASAHRPRQPPPARQTQTDCAGSLRPTAHVTEKLAPGPAAPGRWSDSRGVE